MSLKNVFFYNTVIGRIGIAENGDGITNVFFNEMNRPKEAFMQESKLLKEAIKQLNDYFAGKRKIFNLPLYFDYGTEFQKLVWMALRTIPYGETRTYKQIAQLVGNKDAFRAVGKANNKNPISIFVPCHRVVGANGNIVGYAGGIEIKEKLIHLEKTFI